MVKPKITLRSFSLLLLIVLSTFAAVAYADDEAVQEAKYVNCLLKRGVNPKELSKEDVLVCNKEANVEDPGEDKRNKTGAAWRGCVISKATELDDGVSPASEIARAVVPHCREQWRAFASAFYMTPVSKRQFVAGLDQYGVEAAIQGVLIVRKEARAAR